MVIKETVMGEKKLDSLFDEKTERLIEDKKPLMVSINRLQKIASFYNNLPSIATKNQLKLVVD